MELDVDVSEWVGLANGIDKIANDAVFKRTRGGRRQTQKAQLKKFFKLEGRRIVALAITDPLGQSDGTLDDEVSAYNLRDLLRRKGSYSIVPQKDGMGVRVGRVISLAAGTAQRVLMLAGLCIPSMV